ncbi:hypothetical protein F4779DRAFT_630906 [Xylariaceae sp. FL0662B]|nr:hypothetical protein F4779DRAFT_630906 [Xylariaceae sp. FL0662B]
MFNTEYFVPPLEDLANTNAQPAQLPGSINEDRGPGLRAFNIVMIIVSVFAILSRFRSRSLYLPTATYERRFWWDDWVALIASPFIVGHQASTIAAISLGVGHHIWILPTENTALIAKLSFVIYFLYDAGLFLSKASALLFLSRIFPNHVNGPWFNLSRYTTHGLNIAWFQGIVFGTFFMCDPVEKNWNPMNDGTCGSTTSLFIGSAVPSVIIDLIILILPLPKIWRLQTSRARKIGITIIFLFGYGVVVVSLGRLVTVLTSGNALDTDLTYAGVPAIYWVTAEPPVTLLSICLPALLPLGRHLAKSYLTPMASKVSSIKSALSGSRGKFRSRSGNFSTPIASHDCLSPTAQNSDRVHDQEFLVLEPYISLEERPNMLRTSPGQEQYTAFVRVPDESVYVQKGIKVS